MIRLFDPWFAGHTEGRSPDEITRCLRESIAAMLAADPEPRPTGYEPAVDGDTRIRPVGGKSSHALKAERRPVQFGPYDEHGRDKSGHYNPGADGWPR